jgi:hypothetical protein
MGVRLLPPIYARVGEREVPVRWAWYRPEPEVGDTVRLLASSGGHEGWRSFLVVRKRMRRRDSHQAAADVTIEQTAEMIELDVEPLAYQA